MSTHSICDRLLQRKTMNSTARDNHQDCSCVFQVEDFQHAPCSVTRRRSQSRLSKPSTISIISWFLGQAFGSGILIPVMVFETTAIRPRTYLGVTLSSFTSDIGRGRPAPSLMRSSAFRRALHDIILSSPPGGSSTSLFEVFRRKAPKDREMHERP